MLARSGCGAAGVAGAAGTFEKFLQNHEKQSSKDD
jgi:hypothetical protein